MSIEPLITIITPVYNAEKYIRDCIESVLKQTYSNWEMILVDDCSKDSSVDIVKEYLLLDNRIKLFENEKNYGPAISRNIALNNAMGKYVTFLDSDDMILEDKLKKQVNFMQENNILFSHGNYSFFDGVGKVIKNINTSSFIDYKILLKGNQFKIMTVMIDRSILENKYFLEIKHEDYQFFLEIFKRGYFSKIYSEDMDSLCRININTSVSSNKIKSAFWTWNIYYKYQNLGIIKSFYYFIHYCINGIKSIIKTMNMIICTTPFQMLIADKVIDLYQNEEFYLVVITSNVNNKYKHYYNQIKRKVKKSIYIRLLPTNVFFLKKIYTIIDLFHLKFIGKLISRNKYNKILLANIESLRIHIFLSEFKGYDLYTFDDGTANIIKNSYLYNQEPIKGFRKLFLNIIGSKLTLDKLKSISKQHFTIYKLSSNIIDNLYHIDLFSLDFSYNTKIDSNTDEVRLFLGQPLYDFSPILYKKISKYLDIYNIDYYFHHPREKKGVFKSVEYVETELLFEDYLMKRLKIDKRHMKIYTIFSGSLLNVVGFPNVELIAIKDKSFGDVNELYSIFKEYNIKVIQSNI